jgi:hypothetical protein
MKAPQISTEWLKPFRLSPFSLRFELGGETFSNDAPVPRFIQAIERARDVTRDVPWRSAARAARRSFRP